MWLRRRSASARASATESRIPCTHGMTTARRGASPPPRRSRHGCVRSRRSPAPALGDASSALSGMTSATRRDMVAWDHTRRPDPRRHRLAVRPHRAALGGCRGAGHLPCEGRETSARRHSPRPRGSGRPGDIRAARPRLGRGRRHLLPRRSGQNRGERPRPSCCALDVRVLDVGVRRRRCRRRR